MNNTTQAGFKIIAECIEQRVANAVLRERLAADDKEQAERAAGAALAVGMVLRPQKEMRKSERARNMLLVEAFRQQYGKGFDVHKGHGSKVAPPNMLTSWQIKVLDWAARLPRINTKSYWVARYTK